MSTENDDSDNVREPEAEAPPPPRRRPMLPGPGLGESLLWIVGYMAIQVGFGVVIQNVVGMWTGGDAEALVEKLGQNGVITVMLLPTMLSLLILIPAGIWRLTPEPFRKLNLSPPSLTQLTILLATTAALSLFGSSIQAVVQSHLFPWLEKNNPEVIEDLKRLDFQQLLGGLRNASFPVLLFYLAVVPAVGEELLFRGIIGRGLTARWGIVTGVLLTSNMCSNFR